MPRGWDLLPKESFDACETLKKHRIKTRLDYSPPTKCIFPTFLKLGILKKSDHSKAGFHFLVKVMLVAK